MRWASAADGALTAMSMSAVPRGLVACDALGQGLGLEVEAEVGDDAGRHARTAGQGGVGSGASLRVGVTPVENSADIAGSPDEHGCFRAVHRGPQDQEERWLRRAREGPPT